VTITGGALSAEAGQFSGDVQSSTRVIAVNGGESIILHPNSGGSINRIEGSAGAPLHIVTNGSSLAFAAGGTTPQMILSNVGNLSLSGALNGTSASFSGRVNVNGATDDASKALNVGGNGYSFFGGSVSGLTPNNIGLSIGYNRSGANGESSIIYGAPAAGFNFEIASVTSGTITPRLTITNSGAATFSSIVNVIESNGSGFVRVGSSSGRSQYQNINFGGVTGGTDYGWQLGRSPQTGGVVNDGFYIYDLKTNNAPFVIALGGNVGIGTASPGRLLSLNASIPILQFTNPTTGVTQDDGLLIYQNGLNSVIENQEAGYLGFLTSATERMRVTSDGYQRMASGTGGIQFNGDTAAANALDDYEEGTWDALIRGSETAGTYEIDNQYSTYTKIGRLVTANCRIVLDSSITGGGTGYVQITGLPFSKGASRVAYGATLLTNVDFTGTYVTVAFVSLGATSVLHFVEIVDNDDPIAMPVSSISAGDGINFSITYEV
jgi:hypothetical protein